MENRWSDNDSTQNKLSTYSNPVKLIIQGIPFTIISLGFIWFLFFVGLNLLFIDLIFFLQLVVGLLFLFLIIIGFTNSLLAEALWDIRPNRSVLGFLGQGILFVIMLAIVNPIFLMLIILLSFSIYLNIIAIIITMALLAYVGGYIGKNVAAEFEPTESRKEELASVHDRHISCPKCNTKFTVSPNETDESGGITCSRCGKWISVFDKGPIL